MEHQNNKYQVYGEITIPFYFPTSDSSKEEALQRIGLLLNKNSINLIEGDIHTSDGRVHPLIAPDCHVRLIEVIGEDDI